MGDIDEDSDIGVMKRGKGREIVIIDEDSHFEDIKMRGKGREMSDNDEDSDSYRRHQEEGKRRGMRDIDEDI